MATSAKKIKRIGILTAGGDCPGLNAAVRAVGKAALSLHGIQLLGIRDGFLGLIQNRMEPLDKTTLAGILTLGGTILGTSRIKPHCYESNGVVTDARETIIKNLARNKIDALVCIGGGGTHKNALQLIEKGVNVITLPKTIDNDLCMTDTSFGFDTALGIATEAIDRLHSTAHSHHRIIVAEVMGHRAGWLALGSGIAGGADVILIPEIPYDVSKIAAAIRRRSAHGTNFSIVAIAEGAQSIEYAAKIKAVKMKKAKAENDEALAKVKAELQRLRMKHEGNTMRLAAQLEQLTGLESRVSILGYIQRGGAPSTGDRLLATRLGTACADLIQKQIFGVMVAARGDGVEPVSVHHVAGGRKEVPLDHPWVTSARAVGACFGD